MEENTILKATEVQFPNKPIVSSEAKVGLLLRRIFSAISLTLLSLFRRHIMIVLCNHGHCFIIVDCWPQTGSAGLKGVVSNSVVDSSDGNRI